MLGLLQMIFSMFPRTRCACSVKSKSYSHILAMNTWEPYNNVLDKKVRQFVGCPLILVSPVQKGEPPLNVYTVSSSHVGHQDSWSPTSRDTNKGNTLFDKNLGFVTDASQLCNLPSQTPLDMKDPQAYFRAVDLVLQSGLPNYKAVRIPLPSAFDWQYLEQQITDYHDKAILDYIEFGFPLSFTRRSDISSNATDNHASARAYPDKVSSFIQDELVHVWVIE